MDVDRQVVPAVSPMAATVGYSRAVRVGSVVAVAGTAPVMPDGGDPPEDPYEQAGRCLEIIVASLAEVGAGPEHVVRTRVYLTRADDWPEVGRAHGRVFGNALPASSMLVVAALLDPRWLVEIEADAVIA
jgi:enamine deaminase RidA (YjgF/YER057c/UK114 family)